MYHRAKNMVESVLSQCTHKVLRQAQDYVEGFLSLYMAGNSICGAVEGRFGIYSLFFSLDPEAFYMKCDCPSVHSMCKHVIALGLAYLSNPDSFIDIDTYSEVLMKQSKEDLIKIICLLFSKFPETYKVFETNHKEFTMRAKFEEMTYQGKSTDYKNRGDGI